MLQRANSKRGRPIKSRKLSDEDVSSEEFTKKKAKKSGKSLNKKAETDKPKKKKAPTKSKVELSDSSDSDSSDSIEMKEENQIKVVNIPIEMFTPDKKFAEILNKANKEPEFLIMLRNLLSGCSRMLRDKRTYLNKKWQTLRNSNCTQDEYLSRQAQLKRLEVEEIYDIERDLMAKLSLADIKGFEAKDAIISDYKHSLIDPISKNSLLEPDTQYTVDEQTWVKYHELQKRLLNLLMNEKDLVYSNNMDSMRNSSAPHTRQKMVTEENEMDHRITTIETEENQQATQFLFCKHFSEINYEKLFDGQPNPFKLSENDIYYMDPKALSWILQTKSDEIYTNQKFQRQTFKRYTDMLNSIYRSSSTFTDEVLIEQLLEIAAYILNSVHYYQKFKLKCDLLHPLDLLLVIQKIKKDRKTRQQATALAEEQFSRELDNITSALKGIDAMPEE